ncbi:MAG: exodeoxyribonuclease VII large subunit [Candidatus Staskawiczbacteria bacterium RIFOXYB2_FULL_32_9]|uniref:Exodeoxyribonuclease 7 large subunit n=1 Tax=Candidatus Staskawiczbacteria bacterium RIFOXYD1_FULL_32_13 TaxID=1802234 RepID=A0A1G2JNF5_9BACT|nr:MAG: Exodeoxyribonuclease 7 large subunit [Parcubacteria group bacterium GW2011_GWC2_32_10]OGZ79702.1 MAG: exodeoxyribonuclease VII large subunit [Candidatus Staskawiczbacteria bacterium RIFOXYB1_FULL_32_11]OGZ84344.1 MAG: exodeoxyribonuclease VII large subunit [Candidatus Staskawiczbacteria bacterium RIFOXYB2_FULL_32_9]OGZ85528.1 MAG: exodeoxyribonuclease VII large subunit [Candidatus Staskawiczbacteria bacterium RIFOXYC2_FULL_32_10]OGZ88664.1 MAG: exodeoxyribonuclease VII large subunit [Ca
MEIDKNKIYSISEFVGVLNDDLKWMKAKIVGEVVDPKIWPSGHVYFSLKDQKDGSVLNCIIWGSKYRLFGINLEQGMKIVAFGKPEIYSANGRLSFICETIELAGEGDLKKQYELLKKKLSEEGLFAQENKRPIPKYLQKIGVITSKQGAVIHDFLNNIGKFGFKITLIDSRVEGQGAVEDLLASIKTFRTKDIDVLVIIRGGGSMESLMAFNNELLVREVAGFPVPVVVGIGHDQDVPLVCLASDSSQSTPTAVANLLSASWEQALLEIFRYEKKIFANYGLIFERYKAIENKLFLSFSNFRNLLTNIKINLNNLQDKYFVGFKNLILSVNQSLIHAEKIISSNSPERQLSLGYSIALINGKVVRKTKDAKTGDSLDIKVSDGVINTNVVK